MRGHRRAAGGPRSTRMRGHPRSRRAARGARVRADLRWRPPPGGRRRGPLRPGGYAQGDAVLAPDRGGRGRGRRYAPDQRPGRCPRSPSGVEGLALRPPGGRPLTGGARAYSSPSRSAHAGGQAGPALIASSCPADPWCLPLVPLVPLVPLAPSLPGESRRGRRAPPRTSARSPAAARGGVTAWAKSGSKRSPAARARARRAYAWATFRGGPAGVPSGTSVKSAGGSSAVSGWPPRAPVSRLGPVFAAPPSMTRAPSRP